jgi:hypothetical protein
MVNQKSDKLSIIYKDAGNKELIKGNLPNALLHYNKVKYMFNFFNHKIHFSIN